jgi:hypothetical protein
MPSSGMLRRLAVVRTSVLKASLPSIFRAESIRELGTLFLRIPLQLPVTVNVPGSLVCSALIMGAARSSEPSFLTRSTRRHIPEEGILEDDSRIDGMGRCGLEWSGSG